MEYAAHVFGSVSSKGDHTFAALLRVALLMM
jgi:hypothetical protein